MALSKRRLSVIVLLGILIVSLASRYAPAFTIISNFDTESINVNGLHGGGPFQGADRVADELLDATYYISTWKPGGASQKIVAQGKVLQCDLLHWTPVEYWYILYRSVDGITWSEYDQSGRLPVPSGIWTVCPFSLDNWVTEIFGQFVGAIKMEFWLRTRALLIFNEGVTAVDYAHIRGGYASLSVPEAICFELTDTLRIGFDVAYATTDSQTYGGAQGWTLQLKGPVSSISDGQVIREWSLKDNTVGSRVYTFIEAQANEKWKVILFNSITAFKVLLTVTVERCDLAPSKPTLSWNPNPPYQIGQPVTLTWNSEPNDLTMLPIDRYDLLIYYTGAPDDPVVDQSLQATEYSFTVSQTAFIHVQVLAWDSAERPSPVARATLQVLDYSPIGGGTGFDPYTAPWWMWVGIGMFLFAAFGVQFLPQIPRGGRNIVSIFALAGAAVLFITYLALPVIEAWIREFIPGVF